jgi:alpha-1,6-mannosyltransferase
VSLVHHSWARLDLSPFFIGFADENPPKRPAMSHSSSSSSSLLWLRWSKVVCTVVALAYLLTCPYSKVEESFHLQATHDIYYYGVTEAIRAYYFVPHAGSNITTAASLSSSSLSSQLPPYDHLEYPGVVPRTFLGSFILAKLSSLVGYCNVVPPLSPLQVGLLARLILLTISLSQLFGLADALQQQNTKHDDDDHDDTDDDTAMMGTYFILIAASQFHGLFYASRLLSNTFATIFTTRSMAYWVRATKTRNNKSKSKSLNLLMVGAAADMVLATAIFRCDCLLLLFCCGTSWLVSRQMTLFQAVGTGLVAGSIALIVSVPLDSAMWQHLVWPEGQVLYYNTILNKSSDWGVSAWHWYWTNALPKALLFTYVCIVVVVVVVDIDCQISCCWFRCNRSYFCSKTTTTHLFECTNNDNRIFLVPISVIRLPEILTTGGKFLSIRHAYDGTWAPFLLPALGFVALYSCLGHKEVRFLFPALPLFNIAAAAGLARLHRAAFVPTKDKRPTLTARLLYVAGLSCLAASLAASTTFGAVSTWNYPGGDALDQLGRHLIVQQQQQQQQKGRNDNQQTKKQKNIRIFVDVSAAMTGVSLFGQRQVQQTLAAGGDDDVVFVKAGYESQHRVGGESSSSYYASFSHLLTEVASVEGFHPIGTAPGNPRLDVKRLRIATEDAIYIQQNDRWRYDDDDDAMQS